MALHLRVCLFGILALLTQLVVSFDVSRLSVKRAPSTQKYSYRFSNVAVTGGGFITGFVASETTPDVLYVRTDIGSSYRWDATNDMWSPLTDFIGEDVTNYFGTESIALDPTDDQKLYLMQGEYHTVNQSAIFVSNDRGNTFSIHPTPFTSGSNDLGRNNGERLAVNPFKPSELYFGSRSAGLWKSEDHARTWTNVTNFPNAVTNGIGFSFVIFDPQQKGHIYVGANVPEGLWVSKDSGATWAAIPGQPTDWSATTLYAGHTPQSTAPQPMRAVLSSASVLFVTYGDAAGPYGVNYGQVQKYDTKTSIWTNITPGMNGNSYPPPYTPQAWPPGGFCGISMAPSDPNTVIVFSLDRDPGPAIDSMYLSRDAGKTWKDISQLSTPAGSGGFWSHPVQEAILKNGTQVPWLSFNWGPRSASFGAPDPVVGDVKFGWWPAAVLINPTNPDQVMYGTGATIWATDNISRIDNDWAPTWYVNAAGIEETAILALISPTEGANLLSGFGDIDGFRHDSLYIPQNSYSDPVFISLNSLDWAGNNPNVIVRVGENGVIYPDGCGLGAYSTDGGYGWNKFKTCVNGVTNSSGTGGYIAVDSSGRHIVWTSPGRVGAIGPYYSSDYGTTWTAPTGLNVQTSYLASDKVRPATFYAFYNGTFYLSSDGGASYTAHAARSTGLPATAPGVAPVVNPFTAGDIWLPLGALGLWHSTDFGSTFHAVGHPGLSTTRFSVGAAPPGSSTPALFLWGTVTKTSATGLFRSDDTGATWMRINDDQHQYGGPSLIQADSRVYGRCYMGMNGRGITYADIAGNGTGVLPGTYGL